MYVFVCVNIQVCDCRACQDCLDYPVPMVWMAARVMMDVMARTELRVHLDPGDRQDLEDQGAQWVTLALGE